jgi:sugar phosphate isomerase/epimerase
VNFVAKTFLRFVGFRWEASVMADARHTRRAFCMEAAGGLAVGAIGRYARAADAAKPFALRYVLASSLYGMMKLDEILPEVRKTGAEHIDLWPKRHADQREQMDALGDEKFAAMLKAHGVGLGMTTRYDLGPLRLQDEMRRLKRFGGRLIVTGSQASAEVSGRAARAAVAKFVEEMKPHVAAAEANGVILGIENHANSLIATPDSLRALAELSPSPNLGIALAPYHLPQDETLLAKLIEDLGPKLALFYACQHGRGCHTKLPKDQELEQMPGRGKLDFKPLLAALKKIAFSGWTKIFMHPAPRGIPILETTAKVTEEINRARKHLEDALTAL